MYLRLTKSGRLVRKWALIALASLFGLVAVGQGLSAMLHARQRSEAERMRRSQPAQVGPREADTRKTPTVAPVNRQGYIVQESPRSAPVSIVSPSAPTVAQPRSVMDQLMDGGEQHRQAMQQIAEQQQRDEERQRTMEAQKEANERALAETRRQNQIALEQARQQNQIELDRAKREQEAALRQREIERQAALERARQEQQRALQPSPNVRRGNVVTNQPQQQPPAQTRDVQQNKVTVQQPTVQNRGRP